MRKTHQTQTDSPAKKVESPQGTQKFENLQKLQRHLNDLLTKNKENNPIPLAWLVSPSLPNHHGERFQFAIKAIIDLLASIELPEGVTEKPKFVLVFLNTGELLGHNIVREKTNLGISSDIKQEKQLGIQIGELWFAEHEPIVRQIMQGQSSKIEITIKNLNFSDWPGNDQLNEWFPDIATLYDVSNPSSASLLAAEQNYVNRYKQSLYQAKLADKTLCDKFVDFLFHKVSLNQGKYKEFRGKDLTKDLIATYVSTGLNGADKEKFKDYVNNFFEEEFPTYVSSIDSTSKAYSRDESLRWSAVCYTFPVVFYPKPISEPLKATRKIFRGRLPNESPTLPKNKHPRLNYGEWGQINIPSEIAESKDVSMEALESAYKGVCTLENISQYRAQLAQGPGAGVVHESKSLVSGSGSNAVEVRSAISISSSSSSPPKFTADVNYTDSGSRKSSPPERFTDSPLSSPALSSSSQSPMDSSVSSLSLTGGGTDLHKSSRSQSIDLPTASNVTKPHKLTPPSGSWPGTLSFHSPLKDFPPTRSTASAIEVKQLELTAGKEHRDDDSPISEEMAELNDSRSSDDSHRSSESQGTSSGSQTSSDVSQAVSGISPTSGSGQLPATAKLTDARNVNQSSNQASFFHSASASRSTRVVQLSSVNGSLAFPYNGIFVSMPARDLETPTVARSFLKLLEAASASGSATDSTVSGGIPGPGSTN